MFMLWSVYYIHVAEHLHYKHVTWSRFGYEATVHWVVESPGQLADNDLLTMLDMALMYNYSNSRYIQGLNFVHVFSRSVLQDKNPLPVDLLSVLCEHSLFDFVIPY